MTDCPHLDVSCLNPYDLIRKYRCSDCEGVMMCSCEQEHGERFLPHQLSEACILETQQRVPVTLGFQFEVCPECRGEKPIHAPKASMPGSTSKVSRFYWREIFLETTKRFYDRNPDLDPQSDKYSEFSFPEKRNAIEKEIIDEIKKQHAVTPKYDYTEQSQSDVLRETSTEVILVKGEYIKTDSCRAKVQGKYEPISVEAYAAEYFEDLGYKSIEVESIPFHVLFATCMWETIQDLFDPQIREALFGSRISYDQNRTDDLPISTFLPTDFGTAGYFSRRKEYIEEHLGAIGNVKEEFEFLEGGSWYLREYLWAHRDLDIQKTRTILEVLSNEDVKKILHYMSRNYWKNYCGWPDLLIYDENEYFFVEVKSTNDKLSEDQKNWLKGNQLYMGFDAKVFKVSK